MNMMMLGVSNAEWSTPSSKTEDWLLLQSLFWKHYSYLSLMFWFSFASVIYKWDWRV